MISSSPVSRLLVATLDCCDVAIASRRCDELTVRTPAFDKLTDAAPVEDRGCLRTSAAGHRFIHGGAIDQTLIEIREDTYRLREPGTAAGDNNVIMLSDAGFRQCVPGVDQT